MNKKEFRDEARLRLKQLASKDIDEKSKFASKILKTLIEDLYSKHLLESGHIGVYSPILEEVNWYASFDEKSYKWAVPHMHGDGQMDYYQVNFEDIVQKRLGLKLDEDLLQKIVSPKILVIPGLAFTVNGERLGRGMGYFDRYLSKYNGLKIGICFENQIFEALPTEKHDEKVDYIITEKQVYITKGK